jgi:hypothetical protein
MWSQLRVWTFKLYISNTPIDEEYNWNHGGFFCCCFLELCDWCFYDDWEHRQSAQHVQCHHMVLVWVCCIWTHCHEADTSTCRKTFSGRMVRSAWCELEKEEVHTLEHSVCEWCNLIGQFKGSYCNNILSEWTILPYQDNVPHFNSLFTSVRIKWSLLLARYGCMVEG